MYIVDIYGKHERLYRLSLCIKIGRFLTEDETKRFH